MSKTIIFTVTNDLSFDQRMNRICSGLAANGYNVILVGRKLNDSIQLQQKAFRQKRLRVFFTRGFIFYAEYNLRLFFYLLFVKADAICAIDLDTILPCYFVSKLKGCRRVYDAHELFCEMQEIVTRPRVYRFWKWVEKFTVPEFRNGYTVNNIIAQEFNKMYGVQYQVVRNIAVLETFNQPEAADPYIIYQGAVNEGRCFEQLIPAMAMVNAPLNICGKGNFLERAKELVQQNSLGNKISFCGMLLPDNLRTITREAYAGVTLFEPTGISNYYSLANRFFDYIHAGIPQVCMKYPAYEEINNLYEVAVLIDIPEIGTIAEALNRLLEDRVLYERLQSGCMAARQVFNWQKEEEILIAFYRNLFSA